MRSHYPRQRIIIRQPALSEQTAAPVQIIWSQSRAADLSPNGYLVSRTCPSTPLSPVSSRYGWLLGGLDASFDSYVSLTNLGS